MTDIYVVDSEQTVNVVANTQVLNVVANTQPLIVGTILTQSIFVPESQTITVNPMTLQTVVAEMRIPVIESLPAGPNTILMSSVPAVTVTNAGPPGPSSTPAHPAQEAFYKANGLEERRIDYLNGLPSVVTYYKDNILQYTSTITYDNSLPSLVTLVNELSDDVFLKTILYENGLPSGVEWQAI